MKIQSSRDLVVWQKASDFSVEIYKTFNTIRDFGFRDQVQRAAISIPNNIAEGYARKSDKAFKNFLFISKGSAAEVESLLYIATKLGYITYEQEVHLTNKVHEIYKLLNGFIKKL